MPPEALTDDDELLFRQVHPSFIRDGRPSSQAFRPTTKDAGKLSVARSALTTAAGAYDHHTQSLALASAGSWGITVGECKTEELPVFPDPLTTPGPVPDAAHAVVDFAAFSKGKAEAKGLRLARQASERGRLHPPVTGAANDGG